MSGRERVSVRGEGESSRAESYTRPNAIDRPHPFNPCPNPSRHGLRRAGRSIANLKDPKNRSRTRSKALSRSSKSPKAKRKNAKFSSRRRAFSRWAKTGFSNKSVPAKPTAIWSAITTINSAILQLRPVHRRLFAQHCQTAFPRIYFKNKFRLERVTASYDLNSLEQLEALLRGAPPEWFEITIHQHMPMFHMEHCVFCAFLSTGTDYTNCGRPCDHHDVKLRDRVGALHPLKADAGCRNTVFNARAQTGSMGLRRTRSLPLGARHFRLEFLRVKILSKVADENHFPLSPVIAWWKSPGRKFGVRVKTPQSAWRASPADKLEGRNNCSPRMNACHPISLFRNQLHRPAINRSMSASRLTKRLFLFPNRRLDIRSRIFRRPLST